jgi:hypothetical protein
MWASNVILYVSTAAVSLSSDALVVLALLVGYSKRIFSTVEILSEGGVAFVELPPLSCKRIGSASAIAVDRKRQRFRACPPARKIEAGWWSRSRVDGSAGASANRHMHIPACAPPHASVFSVGLVAGRACRINAQDG